MTERTRDAVLRRLQAVSDAMPRHETEPGAIEEMLAEIDALRPARARATAAMLEPAEEEA